jgi:hypothetical protein
VASTIPIYVTRASELPQAGAMAARRNKKAHRTRAPCKAPLVGPDAWGAPRPSMLAKLR